MSGRGRGRGKLCGCNQLAAWITIMFIITIMIIIINGYSYESTSLLPDLNLRMAMFLISRKKPVHLQNQLKTMCHSWPNLLQSRSSVWEKLQRRKWDSFVVDGWQLAYDFQFQELSHQIVRFPHHHSRKMFGQHATVRIPSYAPLYFSLFWLPLRE